MKKLYFKIFSIGMVMVTSISFAQKNKNDLQFPKDFKHRVFEHIINITDIGVHSAGTIEEKQAADYVLSEFKKNNLETSVETFEFESFDISETILRINQKKVEVLQVCFNPYTTPKFEFNEDFILLESDNTTTNEIQGKIVVASYPLNNMNFFNLFFKNPKLILVISSSDFETISKAKNRSLNCKIIGELKKHQSQNVVGLISSTNITKEEIIISAHYDSYPNSVGADDNASGIGTLIELSNYFMKRKDELTFNIKFVAFGGEEKGLLGSRAYLNTHKDDISNCKLLFNIDQIGGNNIFIETEDGVQGISDKIGKTQLPEYMRNRSLEGIESNWRILAPDAMHIFAASNRPLWLSTIIKASTEELLIPTKFVGNTGSDQMTFGQAGIVSTAIGTSGNEYHSPLDISSQVNKQSLEDCGKIVIRVVLKKMKMDQTKLKIQPQIIQTNKEQNELMAHIRFLASDEMKGREVGSNEAKISARYIAEQFRSYGLQSFNSLNGYMQKTLLKIEKDTNRNHLSRIICNNVVGYKEGSDSILKKEYILLMAHYDHLGIKYDANKPNIDSIYNGARDNGIGTTSLLFSAKELSKIKSKRSIIFLATTGEEEGMLGSEYFFNNCPVPTKSIVFVLNNDGGGFNDVTNIRIGGKNKIKFPLNFWNEVERMNINVLPYPKELNYLYALGDNITFAKEGIPSITISPGFDKIDEEIIKYVHKPCDEIDDNFNFLYLLRFSKVYTQLGLKLSNINQIPNWKEESTYLKN